MDTQTQAQIYLSDQRGCSQDDSLRSFHTFNDGDYFDASRTPFRTLQLFNDDTLKARRSLHRTVEQPAYVILLPVAGGLAYNSEQISGFLEPGQVQILALRAGESYTIENPYDDEFINFIQCQIAVSRPRFTSTGQQRSFHLQTGNALHPLFSLQTGTTEDEVARGFIGCYEGRTDDLYKLTPASPNKADSGVFVFVLNGVFEVQNRLLHERDGLTLTGIQSGEVDFEALSNEAILLLLEVSEFTE